MVSPYKQSKYKQCLSWSCVAFNMTTGDSAHAVPHSQKLCSRDSHIWGIRRGQQSRSAMTESRPGWTTFLIMVSPLPGKYDSLSSETSSLPYKVASCWWCWHSTLPNNHRPFVFAWSLISKMLLCRYIVSKCKIYKLLKALSIHTLADTLIQAEPEKNNYSMYTWNV